MFIVEIKKDDKEKYPSRLCFLAQFVMIITMIVICLLKYKTSPQKVPLRYNENFEVDLIGEKNELIRMLLPLVAVQLIILIIFYLFFELTKRGKMKLSIPIKEGSYELNYKMRKTLAQSLVWISWMIQILLSVILLSMFQVIKFNKIILILLLFFFPFLILGLVTYFLIKLFSVNDK